MKRFKWFNHKLISTCALSGIILYSSNCFAKNLNVTEPIKISKGTFNSLVEQDKKFSNLSYCYIDGKELKINRNINKSNFDEVSTLSIDVLECDINDLYYFDNLKNLKIKNFICLNNNDIAVLNDLDLSNYTLYFDSSNFTKIESYDFSSFDDGSCFYLDFNNIDFMKNDMMDLYYYNVTNYLNEKYSNLSFRLLGFDEEKYFKCKKLDNKLNEIVSSFNFDENTSDYEKILQILFYVNGNLQYDEQVGKFLSQNIDVTEEMHNLYLKYSGDIIGNYLEKNDKNSICCNYTALTSTLAYYSGLDLAYSYGTKGDSKNNGHSWCVYSDGTQDYIVDPTFLDSNVYFDIYRCMTGMKIDDLNIDEYFNSYKARDIVLSTKFDGYKTAFSFNFIDDSSYDYNKNLEYVNEDGNDYYEDALKRANLSFSVCGMSILALLLKNKLFNKKSNKVKKYSF